MVMIGNSGIRNSMADWRAAIDKNYPPDGPVFSKPPSAAVHQFSPCGVLGVMVGSEQAMALNILDLIFGIDPLVLPI